MKKYKKVLKEDSSLIDELQDATQEVRSDLEIYLDDLGALQSDIGKEYYKLDKQLDNFLIVYASNMLSLKRKAQQRFGK
jgi:hypothetical protein